MRTRHDQTKAVTITGEPAAGNPSGPRIVERRMKRFGLVVAAVAIVGLGVAAFAGSGGGADGPDAGLDFELAYLDGSAGNIVDYRGTPVVLNFWASWCPACVAELPAFQEVASDLDGQVQFIGMNMQEVDRGAATALIEDAGVTYPLADDPDGALFQSFAGIGMPTTVLIDADGTVATVHAGALFADDLHALIEEHLLG